MEAVGLLPYEQVLVANSNNGQRGETYALVGPAGSGVMQLNGAMARLAQPGDRLIVMSFAEMSPAEAGHHHPRIAVLDEKNKIVEQWTG